MRNIFTAIGLKMARVAAAQGHIAPQIVGAK